LSDLNGYDPSIHHGTVDGMFAAVCDVFSSFRPFPISDVSQFRRVYRALRIFRQKQFGEASPYNSDRFKQVVVAGREYVREFSQ